MGVSYALMAVAALFLFRAAVSSPWSWLPGAAVAASFGVIAAKTYASGEAGRVAELPGTTVALVVVGLGWPIALLIVAFGAGALASPQERR